MEKNNPKLNFRYTIARKDIPDFVNSLHKIQEHYEELALEEKAKQGYTEAQAVIDHIRNLPDPTDGSKLGPILK